VARPVAVITGASSGLGMVFARKLAPRHDLVLVARRGDRLEALAAELRGQCGSEVTVLAADLTDQSGLAIVAERIATEPELALLVNNAGFGARGFFWESDLDDQDRMHRLHITAILRLSHAALKTMVPKNSGAIINVASVAAFVRRSGSVSYGATKTWITTFTEGIYVELKTIESSVKVQALCPGFTFTDFHDTIKVKRSDMAAPALWLRADFVVDESLKALASGRLFVVPGWRYKLIVGVLSILPIRLRLFFEAAGTKRKYGATQRRR